MPELSSTVNRPYSQKTCFAASFIQFFLRSCTRVYLTTCRERYGKNAQRSPAYNPRCTCQITECVHWRDVDRQVHLGYRRGKRGGVWLVRWRVSVGYRQARLGPAGDEILEGTLSVAAAIKAARDARGQAFHCVRHSRHRTGADRCGSAQRPLCRQYIRRELHDAVHRECSGDGRPVALSRCLNPGTATCAGQHGVTLRLERLPFLAREQSDPG